MFNEQSKKITVALVQKQEPILAKHGLKMLGSWSDIPAHTIYNIYEAPTMEAFMKLMQEPEMMGWLAFNTVETKLVLSESDAMASLSRK